MYFNEQLLKEKTSAVSQVTMPVSEHLFKEALHLTGVTEFGIGWQELTSGQVDIPAQGARFDITFEGTLEGDKIAGTISGTDFLTVRADGRFQLNIHAIVTTNDGVKIAVYENGILVPPQDDSMIARVYLNLEFSAGSSEYDWLNKIQGWAQGTVEWNSGQIDVQVYAA
jgi:hypothetical protein